MDGVCVTFVEIPEKNLFALKYLLIPFRRHVQAVLDVPDGPVDLNCLSDLSDPKKLRGCCIKKRCGRSTYNQPKLVINLNRAVVGMFII